MKKNKAELNYKSSTLFSTTPVLNGVSPHLKEPVPTPPNTASCLASPRRGLSCLDDLDS